jgi:hypothetical protein
LLLFARFLGYIHFVRHDHFVAGDQLVSGWTSIMPAIAIFGTMQLLKFGVFGEYLRRNHEPVQSRAPFIIEEVRRFEPRPCSHSQNPTRPIEQQHPGSILEL